MSDENTENAEETKEPAEKKQKFNTPPLRSINEIVSDLHKNIHPRHLKTRRQGGKELVYIAWYDAAKYLDLYAPGWTYEIRNIQQVAAKVVLTVRLSIPTAEGIVFREATGHEDEAHESYGDPFSNSESQALRRAAAKFGLGQHLYHKQ